MALWMVAVPAVAFAAGPTITLKGGLSIAKVSADYPFFDPATKLGFAGAAAVDVPLGPRLSLAPEIGFAMRGFSLGESSVTDASGNVTGTIEVLDASSFLTVAVPLRLALPTSGPLGFSVMVGPEVAFETGEQLVSTGDLSMKDKVDILRNTDYGVLAGVGADLAVGPGHWGVEGRYMYGLANLKHSDTAIDVHSRNIEILTSYRLGLGR
jgi:hypothetical protein